MKYLLIGIACVVVGIGASLAVRSQPIRDPTPAPVPFVPVEATCPVTGAPCKCGCIIGTECVCGFPTWAQMGPECWAKKQNCVIFVGCKPRKIEGFVCLADQQFCDDKTCVDKGVVVGVHSGGSFWRYDLPVNATDADIRAKLSPANPAGSSRPVGSVQVPTGFVCRT